MTPEIAVLRGDGIGPEVIESALSVLGACVPVRLREGLVGGAAIDAGGDPLPPETIALCKQSNGVLLGAVGGPRWDNAPSRPEAGLLRLRRALGLYANLRPSRYMGLPTPLREGSARRADIMIVRELSGGVYFAEPRGITPTEAFNTWRQTTAEIERVAHVAFRLARGRRGKVTSVDKANVLETSRLWRQVVTRIGTEYPDVVLEHRYVDAAAFELIASPHRFDVVLTENLFGDILSDEAGLLAGSLGLLPSASLGDGPALYEPVHGTAPALVGRGLANPTGAILSVAMMLEHTLARPDLARTVQKAVIATLREVRTRDIGGTARASEFTAAVLRNLSSPRWEDDAEGDESASEWAV
jgi:3-isopropylmalate dehydrogenase